MSQSSIINHRSSIANGFTLIELMIVVVILGLLATTVMPKILSKPDQARQTKAAVDIRSIQSALAMFKTDTGRFPTTAEGLGALVANPGLKGFDSDGYLERVPTDPWGNPYVYISPGLHSKDYDLESLGKDGEDGGADKDADIESWNLQG
jgi:general secretion pathway protein G